MFTGYNLSEFMTQFNSEEKCSKYLFDLKWNGGFVCVRCFHKGFCNTPKFGELKCNRCKHKHSITAGLQSVKFNFAELPGQTFIGDWQGTCYTVSANVLSA